MVRELISIDETEEKSTDFLLPILKTQVTLVHVLMLVDMWLTFPLSVSHSSTF